MNVAKQSRINFPLNPVSSAEQAPLVQDKQGLWHVRGWPEAKAIMLMDVRQAGFSAEQMIKLRRFIPLSTAALDGEEHRDRRRMTGKVFTPTITHQKYVQVMHEKTELIIQAFLQKREADLTKMAEQLASDVAFEIVGLTDSLRPGILKRFEPLLSVDVGDISLHPRKLWAFVKTQITALNFLYTDIRPAMAARRLKPKDDLITHMLEKNAGEMAILIEAVTYGFAGMLTTREFMAYAFQECMRNEAFKRILLEGEEMARYRLLHEILRARPVTEYLLRRAATDLEVNSDEQTIHIPARSLMSFDIKAINRDKRVLGPNADMIDPERPMESQIMWSMYAFGYGAHRCPGETVAILETDIFLRRLLALEGLRVVSEPKTSFNSVAQTGVMRDFRISVKA